MRERARDQPRLRDPQKRYWIYQFLTLRDSTKCRVCGVSELEKELVIDHIDGNPKNWAKENLRLLCRSCNNREWWKQNHMIIPLRESERDREGLARVDGERSGNLLSQQDASWEARVNREREPAYRSWLMLRLLEEGFVSVREAIYSGAERCEISPLTSRRYLQKMVSPSGPCAIVDNRVVVKPEHWAHLSQGGE